MEVIYSRDEVFRNCLEYFNGDELAADVIVNKYLLRNKNSELVERGPQDLFERVCSEFFRIEQKYPSPMSMKDIHSWIDDFKFIIPQGSPLFGIGNDYQTCSLANCFVIASPEDCYGDIFRADEELAQVMKRRGGAGLDISNLRPAGIAVNNAARTADGAVGFMHRFSNTTKEVAQGGRRGALMLSISDTHPQIEDFINIKRDLSKVTGANISVRWSDEFLKAVKENKEFTLKWPVDAKDPKIQKVIKAKDVWEKFITAVWESGEPGCLFWDTITKKSISDCYDTDGLKTVSTNPCGEVPLSEYGSCELMLLNLKSFVHNKKFDYVKFNQATTVGVRLMDDMIDLELEKIEGIIKKIEADPESNEIKKRELNLWKKIYDTHVKARRIGLGVTALGDCIALMGMTYGSDESIEFIEKLFKSFNETVMLTTSLLAKERGTFPVWNWEKEKENDYITSLSPDTQQLIKKNGRRNVSITTISPAGTISLLTQTTSGCEPLYMRKYVRRRKVNQEDKLRGVKITSTDNDGIEWMSYDVIHQPLKKWLDDNPGKTEADSPWNKAQTNEIPWENRLKIQATLQKYINASISSTINLSKTTTKEEISKIYLMAWEMGCKGITIYRDGCRQNILSSGEEQSVFEPRPDVLECDINYSTVQKEPWIFFVGKKDGAPYEIFGGPKKNVELPKRIKAGWIKKNGRNAAGLRTYDLVIGSLTDENERMMIKDIAAEFNADAGSYTRLVSTMLRGHIPVKYICEQLSKDSEGAHMFTLEKVMARVLKKYIKDGEAADGTCKECGGKLIYKDGCVQCCSCGWSRCS